MGTVAPPPAVLLILAAFSRHQAALAWARRRAVEAWGPLALESDSFPFTATDYYQPTMGSGLQKKFFAFAQLVDPARLAQIKLETNAWEADYARSAGHPEPRPLNLDPGYLSLGKLVLASTKNHAHRIYLACGIYAEVTLYWKDRRWQHHPWTYPDYRRQDYQRFFCQCRQYLHHRLREGSTR